MLRDIGENPPPGRSPFRGPARQPLLPTPPNAWVTEYQAPFRRVSSETRLAIRILEQPPTLKRTPATVHNRGSAGEPNSWRTMFQFIDFELRKVAELKIFAKLSSECAFR